MIRGTEAHNAPEVPWHESRHVPKVAYCCWETPSAAASPHLWMAACWLRKRGADVHVYSAGKTSELRVETPFGVLNCSQLGAGHARFQIGLLRVLLRERMRTTRTVFYIHGHNAAPAPVLALAFLRSHRVIYHTQDYLEPGRFLLWEFFERKLARRSGQVICNEPNRGRFMASHFRLRQFPIVVPTYLPRDWPRPEFEPEARRELLARAGQPVGADALLLMHQGGFAGVRCGSALVRALATLPAHFLLVFTGMAEGTPAREELRMQAASLGVTGRIIVLDRLPFDEMQRFTAACDAGILLYPNDGVGNYYQAPGRLTQYLACGLPVLASDFPGLELLILKHQLGVVCDPACPAAIARGVRDLVEVSTEKRQCRAVRLRTTVDTDLCYDRFAGRIEQTVHRASTGW